MPNSLIVIKLSGSLFSSPDFKDVCNAILRALEKRKHLRVILVSGGGETARSYISLGRKLGLDQATLDELGIEASRLNARLLSEVLRPLSSTIIPTALTQLTELLEIQKGSKTTRILVCGGLSPGQSTNAVAALIAEKTRADLLINATDVDGVYDRDPRRFKSAKKLRTISPRGLSEILRNESMEAGGYDLMDPIALKLISRSKISTKIVDCKPSVIERLLLGKGESLGTRIVF